MATTIEEAGRALQAILAKINDSLTDQQSGEIQQALIEFLATVPFDTEYGLLRDLADDTFDDLNRKLTAAKLAEIRSRSGDLDFHVRTVVSVARRAKSEAQELRLEFAKSIASAVTEVADAVQAVQGAVKQKDLTKAADQVDAAISAIIALQGKLQANA
jgi:hypothetical protein